MRFHKRHFTAFGVVMISFVGTLFAANPLIMDQFTADPAARVFEGRVYVYPSHDVIAAEGRGRPGWFCMEDYHVFSSANLTDWTDHGVIVSQTGVDWVDPESYAMWAPDCVFNNGKYYFYFPARPREVRGFGIGVAIADNPAGPFKPESGPIEGVRGIDPCVLIDKDGTAYLYYSLREIFVAKLKGNMVELDGEPLTIANLPSEGLKEGPFVFERNGICYLTYPHVENQTERLEYATSDSPLGPFTQAGVIMDESTSGCWTNHQSIIEFEGQWYLFYHDSDLSPEFDKARSIRADRLFFNDDGTIQKVVPTLRGVGIVNAASKIQIDRYSATSGDAVEVGFLDPDDSFKGWKIALTGESSWVRFNDVDFGEGGQKSVEARVSSDSGGVVAIRVDKIDGPTLARVEIGNGPGWKTIQSSVEQVPDGVHDVFVTQAGSNGVELDWLRFE